jgi:hypothetical protein
MATSGSSDAYLRVVGGKLNLKGGLSLKADAGVKKKKAKKAKKPKATDEDGNEIVVAEPEVPKGTLHQG